MSAGRLFHPEFSQSINDKASVLLLEMKKLSINKQRSRLSPDFAPGHVIKSEDLIGSPVFNSSSC